MSGEANLATLLASMAPTLTVGEYVFCSFANAQYGDYPELEPLACCMEPEGLSLVVPKTKADANAIAYDAVFKAITLQVHSSLDAVGLTAAVASKLSESKISANVVAGYFHDHILVQREQAEKALATLAELTRQHTLGAK